MVFYWSLRDSKSLQVSRTLRSILAIPNNSLVWIFSTRRLISKSSSPCTKPLVTVTCAPITIAISVTFMFHSFSVLQQGLSTYLFTSVLPCCQPKQQSPLFDRFSFFFFLLLLIITMSGRLAESRWLVSISKYQRILCFSFSRTGSGLCINHLLLWLNLNFLHNSQWITLPIQSCFALIYWICLLYDWSFRLCHHIIYINYFGTYCLCLVWYHLSLWRYFVLQLEKIQFFSYGFPLVTMSKFSCLRFRLFVAWNIHTVVFLPIFVS